jgi:hypothetical protein
MLLHWKVEELALGHAAHSPRHAGVEESDDSPENPVRRVGIPTMQAKHASPAEAQHDDSIGMGDDSGDAAKSERGQAGEKGIGTHSP